MEVLAFLPSQKTLVFRHATMSPHSYLLHHFAQFQRPKHHGHAVHPLYVWMPRGEL